MERGVWRRAGFRYGNRSGGWSGDASEPTAFSLQLTAFPSCRVLTADCVVRNQGWGKSCCRDRSRSSSGCRSKNGAWARVKSRQRGKGWSWGRGGARSEGLSEAKAGAWSGRRGRARSRRWCGTMGRGWCEDWSWGWSEGQDSGKGSVWRRRWSRGRSGVKTRGRSGAKGSPSHPGSGSLLGRSQNAKVKMQSAK
jgi:hypothetical protein